jgi:predicted ATPase
LEDALALWRGEPYEEFADLALFLGEIARLGQVHEEARERRVECLLSLGRAAEALAACEPLVQSYPMRERPRALLIEALYRSGRQNEALDAFEEFRRLLSDELGLDPSPALRQLKLDILRHEPAVSNAAAPGSADPPLFPSRPSAGHVPGGSGTAPETVPDGAARGALPVPLAAITGREAEIEQVAALLERVRLLSIVGPGGAGKTRLAIEVAHHVSESFAEGCCYVELAAVAEPEGVAPAITHALGVRDAPRRPLLENLKSAVRERALLLVLDNFEHVTPARSVVRELLGACPRLRVLVTSRTPLQLAGEQEFPLPPLPVPGPSAPAEPHALLEFAAVRLFVALAQAVRPDFRLDAGNAAAVAELCVRLDGLPLALELAAARTRLFSPEVLLRRLEQHPDVLAEEGGDRPDRHRRLSHAISWSHDLLDAREQRVFRRLSLFQGAFFLEAAEAVCAGDVDTAPAVNTLLQQHLVLRRDAAHESRFCFLETIRAFARQRLEESGETADARRRHALHYAELAEAVGPALSGAGQVAALDRLELERDDLHAALTWSTQHDPALALRLAAALWRYWVARGQLSEARAHLERLVDRTAQDAPGLQRAHLLFGAATVAHAQGDIGRARDWFGASLELFRALGDRNGTATVLNGLAWLACESTRLDDASRLAGEALVLCRETGDGRGEAVALNNIGWIASFREDHAGAREAFVRGLEIRRHVGDHRGAAFALCNLAYALCNAGDAAGALELLDEADELLGGIRDVNVVGWSLVIRAKALRAQGDYATARDHLARSLACCAEGGNIFGRAWALTEFGINRFQAGDPVEAERLLHQALDDWRTVDSAWGERQVREQLARIPTLSPRPT